MRVFVKGSAWSKRLYHLKIVLVNIMRSRQLFLWVYDLTRLALLFLLSFALCFLIVVKLKVTDQVMNVANFFAIVDDRRFLPRYRIEVPLRGRATLVTVGVALEGITPVHLTS